MSKKSLPNELLSAYFDDEVTAEERAQVSRAVEQTPASKQVLEDYGQLSNSLRSIQQDVPSPGLRDAVLAQVRPEAMPTSSTSARRSGRRWVMIAGGLMTTAAAGLLLMIWPAGPHAYPPSNVAVAPTQESAESTAIVQADRAVPFGSALASRESEAASDGLLPGVIPPPALSELESHSDDSPERFASLPFESLLEHVTEGQHVPEPGDVVKYLEKVADETVWITLTVVDVQMVAGEIQVLLMKHGINSPVDATKEGDEIGESTNNSNVVILVESDWEKLEKIVADLESQGYDHTEDVSSSVAMQKVQIAQNRVEPTMSRQIASADEERATSSPTEQPSLGQEVPTTLPIDVSSAQAKPRSGPPHAQLSARVSDKDIHAFKPQGRSIFTESKDAVDDARALTANEEQVPAAKERSEPEVGEIFARHSPVRAVILLKKSK